MAERQVELQHIDRRIAEERHQRPVGLLINQRLYL
jgi:hypothetical protein